MDASRPISLSEALSSPRTTDPDFVPPHCPNPECAHHCNPAGWRFHRHGYFTRQARPRRIRRYRCAACRRCFSTQTFDTTYWLKRPELQAPLLAGLVACSGYRQLGRSLLASGVTLQRQAERLGRHAMLFLQLYRPQGALTEWLAIDGLHSFEFSQYWPFELNIAVGEISGWTYAFTISELRRSGRMTESQKERRRKLEELHGTPDPKATLEAIVALLKAACPARQDVVLLSDRHQAYAEAVKLVDLRIVHRTFSSRRGRTAGNPLKAVDHLDRMIRHSGANHKRETIAFSKRRQGALERAAVTLLWMNVQKRVDEKKLDAPTPGQLLGLTDHALTREEILHRRLFPTLVPLPPEMEDAYWRRIPTRQIPNGRRHALVYAA